MISTLSIPTRRSSAATNSAAFMFIERANAGNAEKVLQLVKKTRLIIAGKIDCRGSHSLLPFWRAGRVYKILPKTVQYIPEHGRCELAGWVYNCRRSEVHTF